MPKKEDKSINELFEGKFYCARTFTEEIERIVQDNKGMKYVDAIVFFCEKNNVEVESLMGFSDIGFGPIVIILTISKFAF